VNKKIEEKVDFKLPLVALLEQNFHFIRFFFPCLSSFVGSVFLLFLLCKLFSFFSAKANDRDKNEIRIYDNVKMFFQLFSSFKMKIYWLHLNMNSNSFRALKINKMIHNRVYHIERNREDKKIENFHQQIR
jgi:hypothetical protein